MPKSIIYFVSGMLLLIIVSCKPKHGENKENRQALSKNIEYDVTINNFKNISLNGLVESNYNWYRNNMEGSVRLAYLELLFQNAFSGKLDLYDMNDKKIDTTELKKILILSTDSIQIEMQGHPNKLVDTVIMRIAQPDEITALRFREEWTYDPASMAVTKKLLAIAPIITTISYNNLGNETYGKDKALFWIKFPKEPSNTKVLTKRIITNITYSDINNKSSNTKNADVTAIRKYVELLCDKIFNDSIKAYDVGGSIPANVQISGKDARNILYSVDSIKTNDGKDTAILNKRNPTAIRFLEEWSFDPTTMAIQKNVIGICPVQGLYEMDGITLKGYMPYFWVYFKDVWMPFDGKLELKNIEKKKEK